MLTELTIKEFLTETAGNPSAPGGRSVSALNGALATALTEMVANLTIGRKKYAEVEGQMKVIAIEAAAIRERLMCYIERDTEVSNRLFSAFKLPRETEKEEAQRNLAIQNATKGAVQLPMDIAEEVASVMETIIYVAHKGNRNVAADACVAMMTARACVLGSLLDVRTNLGFIDDTDFVRRMRRKADELETLANRVERKLLDWARTVLLK